MDPNLFLFEFEKSECINVPTLLEASVSEKHGLGVFALQDIEAGLFLLEYGGDLLSHTMAKARESVYNNDACCYMFFFRNRSNRMVCLDATRDDPSFGIAKYINHSRKEAIIKPILLHDRTGRPRLSFQSIKRIPKGAEVLFDYGERRTSVLRALPWLKE